MAGNKYEFMGQLPPLEKNKPISRDRFRYWLNGDIIHTDGATILCHRIFAAHIRTILNIFERCPMV
jgi:hypothetical protein